MHSLISAAFTRVRTALLVLVLIFLAGSYAYVTIPKEAAPEIEIPVFIVNVTYAGISAEDSARLLVEPLERRFQTLQGLRRMRGQAGDGFATVTLEFQPGFDQQQALQSVRDETSNAEPDLPAGANAPIVREIDMSVFPILTVALSGPMPERELIGIARDLQERLEAITGVLQADISGDRDDLLEIIIDPLAVQSYGISTGEIMQAVQNNNQLVAAGAFDTGEGRMSVTIPGTIQSIADVLAMPVQVSAGTVVRVEDVAEVRQTYRDPNSFARVDGQPAIGLDVRKTAGANVIDTVDEVRAVVEEAQMDWSNAVRVDFMQDQAADIQTLLGDLENSVIAAILLVMLTTVLALGLRASLLVAVSIPGSFLGGIVIISLLGFTLNIVVLFALILVVGMLVDGAIVVVELAERYTAEGQNRREAFLNAAQRMSAPVTASTATTLAVFLPLLFWPGTAGQFMFYLPATVIVTLSLSLVMALVFVPMVGTLLGERRGKDHDARADKATDTGPVRPRAYDRALRYLTARPGLTIGLSVLVLLASLFTYGQLGRGVEFFPAVEPDRAQLQIRSDGNLSVHEADRLVRLVERQVIGIEGIARAYARTIGSVEGRLGANLSADVIGTIQIDFTDWRNRPPATQIIESVRLATADLPGIRVQVEEAAAGPGAARPVQIELSADDRAHLPAAAAALQQSMARQGSFTDIASDVPVPNPEIRLNVDREQAARYGVDINTLGTTVRLLTNGVLLGAYLPDYANDEVDIILRYPANERNFAQLADLRVSSPAGMVPISNFVSLAVMPGASVINRVNSRNVQTISAGIAEGTTVAAELTILEGAIAQLDLPEGVNIDFAGEIEDQQEALEFLIVAFVLAVFLMFIILLTQLNSFFQSFLVLSAILFSLAGVLLGLVVRQEAFSVVMSGIGFVALAGIVVNNNIVLIDAYNEYRAEGRSPDQAAFDAGVARFRPVMLTAVTTIAGLMPMVLGMTVDFFGRDLYFNAPSGQFWVQLSTAIAGGLAFSTVVTAFLTPTLLAWDGNRRLRRQARRAA